MKFNTECNVLNASWETPASTSFSNIEKDIILISLWNSSHLILETSCCGYIQLLKIGKEKGSWYNKCFYLSVGSVALYGKLILPFALSQSCHIGCLKERSQRVFLLIQINKLAKILLFHKANFLFKQTFQWQNFLYFISISAIYYIPILNIY